MKFNQKVYRWQGIAIRNTARCAIAASMLLFPDAVTAQIIPDATLPVNSNVTPNGNTLTIEGGTKAGGNLFHSFQQFSLPTGSEAFFNNALDVQNIFSRVTGGNISNIDGLIRANGAANLFLINPNGIIFGSNARLNIGGSFIGSSASSINFGDGVQFSANNPTAAPLLTVSAPVGLGFGSNPGGITVQGQGHRLRFGAVTAPLNWNGTTSGLQVKPGNTLALVGGNLNLEGGIVTAEGGKIELGSVGNNNISTQVGLNATGSQWTFDYNNVQQFGDIQLTRQALANVSGTGNATIQVRGRNLSMRDSSALVLENRGNQPASGIQIRATETIELGGTSPNSTFGSLILADARGAGSTGDITLSSQRFVTQGDTRGIEARTLAQAAGGSIIINVPNVELRGGTVNNTVAIATRTVGDGKGGDLTVNTQQLFLQANALIANVNGGSGAGGQITVNATESVEMVGPAQNVRAQSFIGASAVGGTGDAGRITVNTPRLMLRDGGYIHSSTFGVGAAGGIAINASESVELSGIHRHPLNGIEPSAIRSAGVLRPPATRQALGLGDNVTGNAGNVTINTPRLQVTDGATLTVQHDDRGNAGRLQVNANSILLDNGGSFTATTNSGEGGNMLLQSQTLILRRNSTITATAGLGDGRGNGGNLTINADVITALENSDISANAVQDRGGNIEIRTQGIFGTEFRPQQTPESDITASSQFGLSGTVAITNPEVETHSLLVELPQNLLDTNQQIISGCDPTEENTFTVAGRGGLPEDPSQGLLGRAVWWDNRDLSALSQTASLPAQNVPLSEPTPEIVEANGWIINEKGQVELVAHHSNRANSWQVPANCPPHQSSSLR